MSANKCIPTPHITAKEGEIAKTVLMPGDPLRAKYIAETFLENPVCFNTVRGMLGFTGMYKGRKISVMGSGMGVPSVGIYAYELYNFYNVDNIIRIGSAGSMVDELVVGDIAIAMAASTNSNFMHQYNVAGTFAPVCSYNLLEKATATAKDLGISYKVGNVLTSDAFYGAHGDASYLGNWREMGVMCVEMEAAGLYATAAKAKKNALCLLTISDEIYTGKELSAEDREKTFTNMMKIALEFAE